MSDSTSTKRIKTSDEPDANSGSDSSSSSKSGQTGLTRNTTNYLQAPIKHHTANPTIQSPIKLSGTDVTFKRKRRAVVSIDLEHTGSIGSCIGIGITVLDFDVFPTSANDVKVIAEYSAWCNPDPLLPGDPRTLKWLEKDGGIITRVKSSDEGNEVLLFNGHVPLERKEVAKQIVEFIESVKAAGWEELRYVSAPASADCNPFLRLVSEYVPEERKEIGIVDNSGGHYLFGFKQTCVSTIRDYIVSSIQNHFHYQESMLNADFLNETLKDRKNMNILKDSLANILSIEKIHSQPNTDARQQGLAYVLFMKLVLGSIVWKEVLSAEGWMFEIPLSDSIDTEGDMALRIAYNRNPEYDLSEKDSTTGSTHLNFKGKLHQKFTVGIYKGGYCIVNRTTARTD